MEARIFRDIFISDPSIVKDLGESLYSRLKGDKDTEFEERVAELTIGDCVDYVYDLTINGTSGGYLAGTPTIYGQLQQILKVPIQVVPDEWDRLYDVDFCIQVGKKFIGLKIRLVSNGRQLPEIYNKPETHKKFTGKFGGKVFYLFSAKVGEKKEIQNKEVIDEIVEEIKRLTF